MRREIDYADLVVGPEGRGVPFVAGSVDPSVGLDCKGVAWLALRRCGLDVPAHAILVEDRASDPDAGAEAWSAYLAETEGSWAPVDRAERLGDLVASRSTVHPHGPHVSVLVDESRRLAISANRDSGVVVEHVDRIPRVEAVLRFVGGGS